MVALGSGAFAFIRNRQPEKIPEPLVDIVPPPVIPAPPRIISPEDLPPARVGDSYGYDLAAAEGVPPYLWSIEGPLFPDGLGLDGAGRISGIPTAPGPGVFTAMVTAGDGQTARKSLKLEILEKPMPPPVIPPRWKSLPNRQFPNPRHLKSR
jgi:hypothetical protein